MCSKANRKTEKRTIMSDPNVTEIKAAKAKAEAAILAATNKALATLKEDTGLMPDHVSTNMERKRTGEISAHAVVIRLSI
jgi:hypothetical protein